MNAEPRGSDLNEPKSLIGLRSWAHVQSVASSFESRDTNNWELMSGHVGVKLASEGHLKGISGNLRSKQGKKKKIQEHMNLGKVQFAPHTESYFGATARSLLVGERTLSLCTCIDLVRAHSCSAKGLHFR